MVMVKLFWERLATSILPDVAAPYAKKQVLMDGRIGMISGTYAGDRFRQPRFVKHSACLHDQLARATG